MIVPVWILVPLASRCTFTAPASAARSGFSSRMTEAQDGCLGRCADAVKIHTTNHEPMKTHTTAPPRRRSDRLNHCCTKYVCSMIHGPQAAARCLPSLMGRTNASRLDHETTCSISFRKLPPILLKRTSKRKTLLLHGHPHCHSESKTGRERRTYAEILWMWMDARLDELV